MKIVTAAEMREIDRKTIEEFGMPGLVLMERAGLSVVSKIKELYGRKKIIVLCGSGHNGGDGLVVARNLHNEGWDVRVFLASRPENFHGDSQTQYLSAIQFGVSVQPVEELLHHRPLFFVRHALIVDALFGTGLNKPVGGKVSEVIRVINDSGLPVVSVDIPSGISSDNGQVMGEAVRADCTVTFGLPKRGHFLHPGAGCSGNVIVADIGFPKELLGSKTLNIELIEKNDVSGRVPERRNYSHKGDYGHVLIVAGSRGKTGAALMAAKACLRTGAGLVTVGIPESLAELYQSRVTEEMTLILPDKGDGTLSWKASLKILDFIERKADVLVVGPGMGVSRETEKIMKNVIENSACPMVIDADGINSLRGDRKILTRAGAPLILTPHTGEMARLLQAGAGRARKKIQIEAPDPELKTYIEGDRIGTALSFAAETRTCLVLKGVPTVIATPDGRAFLNSTGNPGMASAGTGDVLTGMISGFLGQNRDPLDACILGVYTHGLAGDIAAEKKGEHSLIATDIIEKIPDAFYSLRQESTNS